MAKNWRNSGFVAKFLTKFALLDERKMALWRQNPLEPTYSVYVALTFDRMQPAVMDVSDYLRAVPLDPSANAV